MYSDIIPPKKSIRKIKTSSRIEKAEEEDVAKSEQTEAFTPYKKTYHTMDGRDTRSKWPLILILVALVLLGGIIYSKYNHTTTLIFAPKTTTFEIKERILLNGIGDTVAKDTTSLPYSLVYIPSTDINNLSSTTPRNPFIAQKPTSTTTTTTSASKEYTMTASTTADVRKITFINKTGSPISLRETTRISVGNVIYYLDKAATIQPTGGSVTTASSSMYRIVGFKDTSDYEKVYAIAAPGSSANLPASTATSTDGAVSSVPPTDVISLLPLTSLPLLKSNIYDKVLDQNAVVVIEQKDLEQVLQKINPSIQEYTKMLASLADIVKYQVTIVDYSLETSEESGRPIGFKTLILEITPIINTDIAKTAFVHFSSEAMKKIQSQVSAAVDLKVEHFPFWMTDVPEEDRVRVQIAPIAK